MAQQTVQVLNNYIDGQWVEAATEHLETVYNPASGEEMARVPLSSRVDVDRAVAAAKAAFAGWSKTPAPRRARILFKYQQLLVEHWDELAKTITLENGKSFKEAYGEVQRGIECVEFAAGAPTLMMVEQLPDIATGIESGMYRYPIGVVAGITPFNFPMMVPCWMFPLAIACGNTFVLKPSERTPLLAARLVELLEEAGLPKGVLNLVNGAHEVVNGLLEHPDVKAISFVGSQPVAEYVYKKGTACLKRVQALAGAKNHSIVLADANLEASATQIVNAAFGSAGERCMACSVVTVQEEAADELISILLRECEQMNIGDGLDDDTFLGPVIRQSHKDKTVAYIEQGVAEGAKLLRDGRADAAVQGQGYFIGPTLFDGVTREMKIWQEEIFAPVLAVIRVKDVEEAIEIANASRFANGACIFTNDGGKVRYFRENIESGMLGVNVGVPAPMAFFPFSGWKDSFYGDLHANGSDGVEFYTRKKVVTARWQ